VPPNAEITIKKVEASRQRGVWGFFSALPAYAHFIYWGVPLLPRIRPAVSRPRVLAFFRALRAAAPAELKIGAAGFCWGGKYTFMLCADEEKAEGRSLIDAGYTAHPSMLSIPEDVEKVRLPISVAAAGNDRHLPGDQVDEMRKILEGKGKAHEVINYEGAAHGFAVRGSKEDKEENRRGQEAEDQAVTFFERCLL